MNKTTEAFETWWADTGEQSLYALNTTTDDDIKTIAGIAWEAAIREALADHSGDANEMVGCAYCDNPLFAGTKCNNCGKAALSEPEMNLNCPSVQARLATVWGYVKAEHVKQEPLSEALQIASVALQDIACSSQTENLLWWQIRAREAQKQVSERFTSHAPVQPVKQEPVAFRTMELRVEPVKQEPVMDYEHICALREIEQIQAGDSYFFVRPENDTPTSRKMFFQGFERGFHKGLKYAAPVSAKREWAELTDYEIVRLYAESPMCDSEMIDFARAVIAADREKNK